VRRALLIDEQQSVKDLGSPQTTRNFLFALLDKVLVIRNWQRVMCLRNASRATDLELGCAAAFSSRLPSSQSDKPITSHFWGGDSIAISQFVVLFICEMEMNTSASHLDLLLQGLAWSRGLSIHDLHKSTGTSDLFPE
jgi:hypothetical protein